MFRHELYKVLFTLALLSGSPIGAATPVPPVAPVPPTSDDQVSYSVSTREAGSLEWKQVRTFSDGKEALVAARGLTRSGIEVEVLPRLAIKRLPASAPSALLPRDQTVTPENAQKAFRWLAGQRDIAFRFPADGCYARAHLMVKRLRKQGYKPAKVWAFANGGLLYASTPYARRGHVEWKYHVAPVLRVRIAADKQLWYVIDPSLFDRPVTIREWRARMKRPHTAYEPYSTVTPLGQAPKDPRGVQLPGSGYWAGRDPADVDEHAVNVMRLYKQKEFRAELHRPLDLSPGRLDLDDPRRLFALAA
ncbi:MAG: protein-glutamine glutaminase family protein [Gemmataceae bacterium]